MASSRSALTYADFLLPELTPDRHLVDVGCGSGELSLGLAAEVRQLTGIDADPTEIEAARTAAEASPSSNAAFMVGDAYALPLPAGAADAVLAHSVLEALDRPADTLSGLATAHDLALLREAWLAWSESPASYAAFAWCRALGWKV